MARPQQPELARSAKTDIDPDHVETGPQGQPPPTTGGETGPIPADNQPGHHPAKEQDKPDLDAFAAKLGADPKASSATKARKPARPKATPATKGAASKAGPIKAGPANAAKSPAKPAAAPVWPESAPAADNLGPLPDPRVGERFSGISASQPAQEQQEQAREPEPFMVALAMLPLRETVKRLEHLEQTLSKRLMARAGRGPTAR